MTFSGLDTSGVSIRTRSAVNPPCRISTGAPLIPLPPISIPKPCPLSLPAMTPAFPTPGKDIQGMLVPWTTLQLWSRAPTAPATKLAVESSTISGPRSRPHGPACGSSRPTSTSSSPSCPTCYPTSGRPVVVPVLLSSGYHVHVDIAAAVAAGRTGGSHDRGVGPGPGPGGRAGGAPRRCSCLLRRPICAGAAGSSDRRAVTDVERTASALTARLGRPVVGIHLRCRASRGCSVARMRSKAAESRLRPTCWHAGSSTTSFATPVLTSSPDRYCPIRR